MPKSKSSRVVLQVRLLVHRSDGAIEDRTHDQCGGLPSVTSDASVAVDVVKACENRLRLLKAAVQGRRHIAAELVQTMIDDLLVDLEHHAMMPTFVRNLADLLNSAELLPPLPNEGQQSSLKIVRKPVLVS